MRSTPERPEPVSASEEVLLRVDGLTVDFVAPDGAASRVVDGVSFDVRRGEKFALVGESGSGKTVTALSVMRLHAAASTGGRIVFDGESLLDLPERAMRGIRGARIGMIFQEPMSALNPLMRIGDQICEVLELHEAMTRGQAERRAIELLAMTRIPEPERRFASYPHQLSGGQRQRAMIAMAIACRPRLLIADEPTTALDVTIQRQLIEQLDELQRSLGMAMLLITHDLPLVRAFADRVGVMKDGRLLECGPTAEVFASPRDPYTRRLIDSRPRRTTVPVPEQAPVLLEGQGVGCRFAIGSGWFSRRAFEAVKACSVQVRRGETLGVVGESGSGKTTLGMTLLRLQAGEASGEVQFEGRRLDTLSRSAMRPLRRHMQVVFQDPFNALSPRLTVGRIVGEGLELHRPDLDAGAREAEVASILEEVGLRADMVHRYPHEFSGGQRQRIAIARAVVLRPALILLDEPTSALDVSVQQQVLELLSGLQRKYGLSYLLISHDLAVIRAMAHRVVVMKDGAIVESGETEAVFAAPRADYTRTLVAAAL